MRIPGVTPPELTMNTGKTLFAQLMDFLPWTTFTRIVERHGGDRYVKSLTCTEQFRVMAFAQLTYRESLRDIEVCLSAQAARTAVTTPRVCRKPVPRGRWRWSPTRQLDTSARSSYYCLTFRLTEVRQQWKP